MVKIFFTSDQHYDHKRVIQYCNRPFASVDEMNKEMIKRHNEVVGPDDHVYMIGDFCFAGKERTRELLGQLNGKKFFIRGNHDKGVKEEFVKPSNTSKYKKDQLMWIKDLAELTIQKDKQKIIMCHYALKTWNRMHHNAYMLHGHSHGSLRDDPNSLQIDVGVDCWDFYPVSYEQIKEKMSTKKFVHVDKHGQKVGKDGKRSKIPLTKRIKKAYNVLIGRIL